MTWWSVVRFLHVLSAALWVGGQLTVSLVLLPVVRRSMDARRRGEVLTAVGRRFGLLTAALLLPVQVLTGVAIAWHKGVTWASLADPGYGRILAAKLLLFCAVMAAAALHGLASAKGRPGLARAMAVASLAGSLGVILLATALPVT